jgi:hypothetical protein
MQSWLWLPDLVSTFLVELSKCTLTETGDGLASSQTIIAEQNPPLRNRGAGWASLGRNVGPRPGDQRAALDEKGLQLPMANAAP